MKELASVAQPLLSQLWLHLGAWLAKKDLGSLAETCYGHATSGRGKTASEAGFRLSQLLLSRQCNRKAAVICIRVIRQDPAHARAWCALGAALRRMAKMASAQKAYENALSHDPHYAQAWCNLGEWRLARGNPAQALEDLDTSLAIDPKLLEALNNRIAALYELRRFEDAEAAAKSAIEMHPGEAALHVNMGNILLHTGKARPAVKSFRKALECDPNCAEAHLNLATMFGETHHVAQALALIKSEIAAKGESAQRLASLAHAQNVNSDILAAEATCRKVLAMQPDNVSVLITLAGCLSTRGDHIGAIKLHQQALVANPKMPAICSNIAFNSTYLPDISAEELFAHHRQWADRFEVTETERRFSHKRSTEPDRPLRIAYVSGDFGHHPVGFLIRDVLCNHNREKFFVHCYSMMRQADPITMAIRAKADSWIDALLLSDDELAEQVHQDRIDILVDLSGHTAYNRLAVFTRTPAPVQATWIGYFHSTGLETIDYFITDPHTSPKGSGQRFSETPVWLPHSRFCYSPPDYSPAVSPTPALALGHVTFGSFNRIEKLVDPVVAAWARIVNQVDRSRLVLKAKGLENEGVRDHLLHRFAEHGLAADRLELRSTSAHPDMLEQYSEIDIALDPFPFNGGMTTLEALWMGVPVVTISGHNVVSRQTVSVLENLGVADELAFPDFERYITGAVALAGDTERIARLRGSMRASMVSSPIRDARQFCSDLENLYRRMWHAWCRGEKLPSDI